MTEKGQRDYEVFDIVFDTNKYDMLLKCSPKQDAIALNVLAQEILDYREDFPYDDNNLQLVLTELLLEDFGYNDIKSALESVNDKVLLYTGTFKEYIMQVWQSDFDLAFLNGNHSFINKIWDHVNWETAVKDAETECNMFETEVEGEALTVILED